MKESELDFIHQVCHALSYKKDSYDLECKLVDYYEDFSFELLECIHSALFNRKEKFFWWAAFREHYYKMQKLQGAIDE